MSLGFFASDLHGEKGRYRALLESIANERPHILLLGGDLLPHGEAFGAHGLIGSPARQGSLAPPGFLSSFLGPELRKLRESLGAAYPAIFAVLGNDDPGVAAATMSELEAAGLLFHAHMQRFVWEGRPIFGYACVPPTPFPLKDWERYDVSRYVDPGSVSPEEGYRTSPFRPEDVRYRTIAQDLRTLAGDEDLDRAIFLFHAPPYGTPLDRAALDGCSYEGVPLDVHIGSIAIERFITDRQPMLTLHGHVHEAARLTQEWKYRMGRTVAITGAHDGPELALVRFDPDRPGEAERVLMPVS